MHLAFMHAGIFVNTEL